MQKDFYSLRLQTEPGKERIFNMFFDQIIEVVTIFGTFLLSLGAIIVAYIAFSFSKLTYKTNISIELFKEYKSNDMGKAIKYLWDRYNKCNRQENTLVNLYIAEYQNDKSLKFHFLRRKVSNYFQEVTIRLP